MTPTMRWAGCCSTSCPVSEFGKGGWAAGAAVEEGVPAHVLTAALDAPFSSPGEADLADRVLSAMRKAFGGHVEKPGPA